MGYPLKQFTIAVTGDFGKCRGHDKMKQWITRNGGKFAMDISPRVTHLICSKEHYKKAVTMVKQAHFLKTVHIVSFDWLEDSLMRGRPRNERDYLMGPRVKAEAATKAKKKKVRNDNIKKGMEAFEKSIKDFEQDMNSSGYGIYHDPLDNFPYDITLVRPSLLENKNERYRLKVCSTSPHPSPQPLYIPPHRRILAFQHPNNSDTSCTNPSSNSYSNSNPIISTPLLPIAPPPPHARAPLINPRAQRLQLYVTHSVPKYYSCYVKYSAPNTPAVPEMLAPIGSGWETAWGVFESFFRLKTGREWAEREGAMWRMGSGGSYVEQSGERLFEYNVPPMAQPRGAVGSVDHEAILEREVERLKGLGVRVGEEWSSHEGQDEGNGGVRIEGGEECSMREGGEGDQQEPMGVGEYETRIALEGGQRLTGQEVAMLLGTSHCASQGQNALGFRTLEEQKEALMKAKPENAKAVEEEQYPKGGMGVLKLVDADNGAGGDGNNKPVKSKRKNPKIKPKPLGADEGAGVGGGGENEFRKFEMHASNVPSEKMKRDYEEILKEQTDAQERWEKLKHM